ncbi:MAG: type II toxin-antitoxin system VapB family antitoxin [Acidimicrobiales bacterium]
MGKTMVDLDDDALQAAKVVLGTATKKDTINQALEAVVAAARRADAVATEIERGHTGFYRRLLDDDVADVLRR